MVVWLNSLAQGLIRAIDVEKKLFYVLTPVEYTILQNVNTFVSGDLETFYDPLDDVGLI